MLELHAKVKNTKLARQFISLFTVDSAIKLSGLCIAMCDGQLGQAPVHLINHTCRHTDSTAPRSKQTKETLQNNNMWNGSVASNDDKWPRNGWRKWKFNQCRVHWMCNSLSLSLAQRPSIDTIIEKWNDSLNFSDNCVWCRIRRTITRDLWLTEHANIAHSTGSQTIDRSIK